ncbi:hypothetical protein NLU14_16395 [Marinobacter sp. 71-i]|uniref:Uncharacterized protein n=1 Tax=Marinobacter iranensis TaxID=2962607 RepID=A0ABT5YDY2_9GAMM|nr:hypothetical protein [Marinobacter iranensis]MDF0751812.1 hypothetical protein [Marinobacter iranensis]
MKRFLIGSCLAGLMMATAPAMADSYEREDRKAGFYQKVDHGGGAPHHKKFLSSQHRDRYADHGYRDRKHGWKHKKYSKRQHGWKHKKYLQRKHGYHGHKHHWNKSRHHYRRDHGTRFQFHYNSGSYPLEHQVLQGAQLLIDVTR